MAQKEVSYQIETIDDITRFQVEVEKLELCYQRTILEFLVHEFEKFDFNKVRIQADILGDFDFCIFINHVFVLWISVGSKTQIISIYGAEYRWDEECSQMVLESDLFLIYKEIFEGKYRAILKRNKKGELLGTMVYFRGISECRYTLFSFSKEYIEEVEGVNLYSYIEMTKERFYKLYLPALKKSFDYEKADYILDPEEYIMDEKDARDVMAYIEKVEDNAFLDLVAYYFDAKNHNFRDVGNMDIDVCRNKIINDMSLTAKLFRINLDK